MTLTIRTPAKLFDAAKQELLASGIAVIWGDAQEWGGIFDAQDRAVELRAAVADQPLIAHLQTQDGRTATVTLSPSEFLADGERPLAFRGQGEMDTAQYKAFLEGALARPPQSKDK